MAMRSRAGLRSPASMLTTDTVAMPSDPRASRTRPRSAPALVLRAIALAFAWLGISACVDPDAGARGTSSSLAAGAPAVDFTARGVDGHAFHLGDHLGKEVVLLAFWSTSCEPCRAELPELGTLADRGRARGLLVVGVATDDPDADDVASFVRRFDVGFPVVLDGDGRISAVYDRQNVVPLVVVFDRAGRVAAVHEGYSPQEEASLEADVDALLAH